MMKTNPMGSHFLLVCDSSRDPWSELVREVLKDFGTVATMNQQDIDDRLSFGEYSAIILDDASLDDTPRVVRSLRSRFSHMPIVVATSSPTWKRATDSLRAGANDYIYETFNRDELVDSLEKAFGRTLNGHPTGE